MDRLTPAIGGLDPGEQWIGVNYWSRAGGPRMWREYDPQVVAEELDTLGEHGLNLTRSFFFWPDFHPEPDVLDESCLARFGEFLDAHSQRGMKTIPTFIVGHMSGENWSPSWRGDRDLYRDVWFVARQAWYIRTTTARFASHEAIAGWLISNEVPIFGGASDHHTIGAWCELMVNAVRAGGGSQPVSIGDGAWGQETTGEDNGFRLDELAKITDFAGPHIYPMETDLVRQHLRAAFACELVSSRGIPTVLEEFGLSSDFASTAHSAQYYRQVLYTSMLAGARGWIAWNNTDYDDLGDRRPYSHHPFEMHFGVTDSQGRPKPALAELRQFSQFLDELGAGWQRTSAQAGILMASYGTQAYPFTQASERTQVVRNCEQAYLALREASLVPALVHEPPQDSTPRLLVVPSAKQLTTPTWRRLRQLAESGATVYVSYGTGDCGVQRGPWWTDWEDLFGVSNELHYGLNDPVDGEVVLTMERDFGSLDRGAVLRFRAAGSADGRSLLPVSVRDGELIAVDAAGRPAIVRKRHGAGQVVLCTYPVEFFAAVSPRVNPEDTWRLYDALAVEARVRPLVAVDDPRVFVDMIESAVGVKWAVVVSQHETVVSVRPRCERGGLVGPDGSRVETIELAPFGVATLRYVEEEHDGDR